MFGVLTEVPAADRSRWLAELADALDEAHPVLCEMAVADAAADAFDLSIRIEAARLEVQSLRLSRASSARWGPEPKWTNLLPWTAGLAGS